MENIKFEKKLKELELTKKEFINMERVTMLKKEFKRYSNNMELLK
ncbi:hypothetical protein ACMWEF_001837 [Campylobacter jejuni]|nr:hypothetical protein [Campylobacter jejuni]KAJ9816138.1 hypothetical protein QR412_05815 [Campylobacter jejuni]MCW1355596.1 hypothetical protein [Campylobacter jejuni]